MSATAGVDFYGQFLHGRYYGTAPDQSEGNPSDGNSFLTRRNVSLVDPSLNVVRSGAYLELGLTPTRRLLILPGVRADYYGDIDHFSFDPRVSARYGLLLSCWHPRHRTATDLLAHDQLLAHALGAARVAPTVLEQPRAGAR